MVYQLVLGAGVLTFAVAALVLLDALIRRPALMAALVLPAILANYVVRLPNISFGPFNLYINDVLVSLALAAIVARLLRGFRVTIIHQVLMMVVFLGFLSFARGLPLFGAQQAFNSLRHAVFPLALAAYFAVAQPSEKLLSDIRRYWIWAALALTGLAVIRWAAAAAGLASIEALRPPATAGTRVLDSNEALVIAQGFLMTLAGIKGGYKSRTMLWIGGWLFAIAVLLEHRSVWVVLLVCLAVVAVRDPQLSRRLTTLIVGGAAAGSLLAVTVFSGTAGEDVAGSLAGSATNTGTWEWRVEGWRQLIEDARDSDTLEKVIGRPLGTPYERTINTRTVTSQPHNYYIQSLLGLGAAGLALLVGVYVLSLTRLAKLRFSSDSALNGTVLIALLVSQLVYFINYAPRFEQGILLGIVLAVAARGVRVEVPEPAAEPTPLVVARQS